MQKFNIDSMKPSSSSEQDWLYLLRHAVVEVTSEETGYPSASAFEGKGGAWRAGTSGTQIVRLLFPPRLKHISLVFEDIENARTQEFVLRWSPAKEGSFHEIVRQQWNFSPGGSVLEIEDYAVELPEVLILELIIAPDKSHGHRTGVFAEVSFARTCGDMTTDGPANFVPGKFSTRSDVSWARMTRYTPP